MWSPSSATSTMPWASWPTRSTGPTTSTATAGTTRPTTTATTTTPDTRTATGTASPTGHGSLAARAITATTTTAGGRATSPAGRTLVRMDDADQRTLAVDLFNHVWTLLDKPDRTERETDLML